MRAELGGALRWFTMDAGDLTERHRRWIQSPEHWAMFLLDHEGAFSFNGRAFPFERGFVAIVPPSSHAGFVRVGEGTPHRRLTFALSPRGDSVALPVVADLGDRRGLRWEEAQEVAEWLGSSLGRGIAFAQNLLWSLARPVGELHGSPAGFRLERLVAERIARPLRVADLARDLGTSPSQLLRAVRAEYGKTVQEFIKERRTDLALALLAQGELPIKAIAARTGLGDLQSFNKAVRAASGLSPRAIRGLADRGGSAGIAAGLDRIRGA